MDLLLQQQRQQQQKQQQQGEKTLNEAAKYPWEQFHRVLEEML